jgi:hypothetical protein
VERALVARRQEKKGVLDIEIASEILKVLLDPRRYLLKWKPSPPKTTTLQVVVRRVTSPHLHAFLEYLKTEPVKIITKDQWDQFYEFNASVSWAVFVGRLRRGIGGPGTALGGIGGQSS